MTEPQITPELVKEHGLTEEDYQRLLAIMGREPSYTELGIFSVMWSEHCCYKSSKTSLKRLPTTGACVLQGPGENAGVVDIGDGLAAIFKMESHNHPSYIEPYQGAATGVGGILRDIFTMGARPIASLNSLRFGEPDHPRMSYLVQGVVAGIGGYGNCMGVPTVGGEVQFHPCYNGNILVNAFNLGIVKTSRIFLGTASGEGNPVIYVGSRTGRDGIHGATMASDEFSEETEGKRPTVQVGDPFTEKLLLEACLELMKTDYVVGIQDMGAAGLTCSTLEMAGRAGSGIVLDLDRVPRREEGMTPYELMLSESQERMLLVSHKGTEDKVLEIFHKWDLQAVVVGTVTDDGRLKVLDQGTVVADLPVLPLSEEAPVCDRPEEQPPDMAARQTLDLDALAEVTDLEGALQRLLASPNIAEKRWVWEQYDHSVRGNSMVLPGSDAAVIRVKGTDKALAMSVDCNSRYCHLDPVVGGMIAVAEAARNVACSGGRPLAVTDCLNFGNPEKPEVMWSFRRAVDGLSEACRVLDTPVIGGNVSFYNETQGQGIYPTPTIGMVGLLEQADNRLDQWWKGAGDAVVLLGRNSDEVGGSEFLAVLHEMECGKPPSIDLEQEKRLHMLLYDAAAAKLLCSAHDTADGGLAVALAESSFGSDGMGCRIDLASDGLRRDLLLFAETQSRVVASCTPGNLDAVLEMATAAGVPATVIGSAAPEAFSVRIDGTAALECDLDQLRQTWREGFTAAVFGD
jgi:phosphoribosylformylglycinamidine synthase II